MGDDAVTRQVALEDVVLNVTTWNPLKTSKENSFDYIDISSVGQESKTIESPKRVLSAEAPSRARQLVRADDVIVSTVRPNLNAVAQVPVFLDGATASTGFCVLRADAEKLDSRFLFHWVKSPQFVDDMTLKATGASYPAVSDRIIKESKIPLPPLPEQRRIAAILDKADALRAKRRQSIATLDALLQSVFIDMFGDPVTNPMGWILKRLEEIAGFVGGGTPRRDTPVYYTGEICWATSKDMKGEILRDTQEHITQEAIVNSATKLVPAGTILMVVKSKILMRYLPVLISAVPTCFGQDLKGITLQKNLSTRYVARHLRIGQRALLEQARGVNTEGLTLEHLRNYQLMFPPMDMITHYDKIEAQLTHTRILLENELKKLDKFQISLQQRAFTGEL